MSSSVFSNIFRAETGPSNTARAETGPNSHSRIPEVRDTRDYVRDTLKSLKDSCNFRSALTKHNNVIRFGENVIVSLKMLSEIKNFSDVASTCVTVHNLFCTGSTFVSVFTFDFMSVFGRSEIEVQDDGSTFHSSIKLLRKVLEDGDDIWNYPLIIKFRTIFLKLLVRGWFEGLNIDLDSLPLLDHEKKSLKKKHSGNLDLYQSIFYGFVSLIDAVDLYLTTNSLAGLRVNEQTIGIFLDKVNKCKELGNNSNNLETVGSSYSEYLYLLQETLESGISLKKCAKTYSNLDLKFLNAGLYSVQTLLNKEICRKSCRQTRETPYGMLVYGRSSIGKSSFMNIVFDYFGKINGLPSGDHFKYTRNFQDEFWSGFSSDQWCIQMDDIAFKKPTNGVDDQSVSDILNVINSVPFTPPQADLESKGTTPVLAKLCIASTNTESLNADKYYQHPFPVLRRFTVIIELTVKPEFQTNGRLDSDKCETGMQSYSDFWIINVKRARSKYCEYTKRELVEFEKIAWFDNIEAFLEFMRDDIYNFRASQIKAKESTNKYASVSVCVSCKEFASKCQCVNRNVILQNSTDLVLSDIDFKQYSDCKWMEILFFAWCKALANLSVTFHTFLACSAFLFNPIWIFTLLFGYIMFSLFSDRSAICRFLIRKINRTLWDMTNFIFQDLIQQSSTFYNHILQLFDSMSSDQAKRVLLKTCLASGLFIYSYKKISSMLTPKVVRPNFCLCRKEKQPFCLCRCGFCVFYSTQGGCQMFDPLQFEDCDKQVEKVDEELTVQSAQDKLKSTEHHFEKSEIQNVWFKDEYECTAVDVQKPSSSLSSASLEQVVNYFSTNIFGMKISCFTSIDGVQKLMDKNAHVTALGGHIFATNNHHFLQDGVYSVVLYHGNLDEGVGDKVEFNLDTRACVRDIECDLFIFECLHTPPRKNILKFLAKPSFKSRGESVMLVYRDNKISYLKLQENRCGSITHPKLGDNFLTWVGRSRIATQGGECGALVICLSGHGPVVTGLHVAFQDGWPSLHSIHSTRLNMLNVQAACDKLNMFCPQVQTHNEISLQDSINLEREVVLQSDFVTRDVKELKKNSLIRYCDSGSARVFGTIQGARSFRKSRVSETPWCGEFLDHYNLEQVSFGKPVLSGWEPWRKNILPMLDKGVLVRESVLKAVTTEFIKDIKFLLKKERINLKEKLCVLSPKEAVNGLPGVRFIDKINRNTSMGFPWCETKKNHLFDEPDERFPDGVNFNEAFWERVVHIEENYKNQLLKHPIFNASPKDEPMSVEKIQQKKIRLFAGAPVDWGIVVRRYYLSFVKLMQENKFIFEAAPGTVAQSKEWDEFYTYLTQHGKSNMVAGDYGKFDKKMLGCFILAAFKIIYSLHEDVFDDDSLKVMWGIAEDTAFPFQLFNGDLIQFFGTNPSGHPLTVIINCLVNSLYMRYCYFIANPDKECSTFKNNVALLTYGDDNIAGINSRVAKWFNHTVIQRELSKIGVEYTMADKESKSVALIDIDQCSFLKRTWRYEDDLKAYVCPLDENSIVKSFTVWIPSKTVSCVEQFLSVIQGNIREYFWYGREKFEYERSFLQNFINEHEWNLCENSTLPTWEELIESYRKISTDLGYNC